MVSKKGRQFENELAGKVFALSDGEVVATTMGYSGNHAAPSADLLTISDRGVHATEVKITSGEYASIGSQQIQQLKSLNNVVSRVQLLFRFGHREPLLIEPDMTLGDGSADMGSLVGLVPDVFDPRVTSMNGTEETLRLTKPSLDGWKSSRSGNSAAEQLLQSHGVMPV